MILHFSLAIYVDKTVEISRKTKTNLFSQKKLSKIHKKRRDKIFIETENCALNLFFVCFWLLFMFSFFIYSSFEFSLWFCVFFLLLHWRCDMETLSFHAFTLFYRLLLFKSHLFYLIYPEHWRHTGKNGYLATQNINKAMMNTSNTQFGK